MQACDEAVIAGDLVAFGELGNGLDLPFDILQLPGQRADAHDRLQLITKTLGVDLDGVALEHTTFFKPAQALGDAGRRQAADLRQGLERAP
ncbi:hypothetical protein D3C84_923200 [compost metagenome]